MWRQISSNKTTITWLFRLWLFFLPFSGKVLSVSIGFMTLFPSFILLLLLQPAFFKSAKETTLNMKWLLVFVLLFGLHTLIYGWQSGFAYYVTFDVHSVMMWGLTLTAMFGVFLTLGKEVFRKELVQGLSLFLVFILSFGMLEFFTGIHVVGNHTDLIQTLEVNNVTYAPVFLYDNVNDYTMYCVVLLALVVLLTREKARYYFHFMTLLSTILFFSAYSSARASLVACLALFVWLTIYKLKEAFAVKYVYMFGAITMGAVLVFLFNPLFFGPKYSQKVDYRLNEMLGFKTTERGFEIYKVKDSLSTDQQKVLSDSITHYLYRNESSDNVRLNLIKNGAKLFLEHPFLGNGSGSFERRHLEKSVPYSTNEIINPHNFMVEMVVKYGALALGFFLFLLVALLLKLRRMKTNKWMILSWLVCMGIAAWMSAVPSSFMYLNLLWVLSAIVVLDWEEINTVKDVK